MPNYWNLPEDCRSLPARNLEARVQVAHELLRSFHMREDTAPKSDRLTEWTTWIKQGLIDLANPAELRTYPERANKTAGEFMKLDMCFHEIGHGKRILLAVESELNISTNRHFEILQDFDKLLAVKSAFKLMVYSSGRKVRTNPEMVEKLELYLQNYQHHLLGETYIFVDYNENNPHGDNGRFIAHTWQPSESGPPAKLVPFAEVD